MVTETESLRISGSGFLQDDLAHLYEGGVSESLSELLDNVKGGGFGCIGVFLANVGRGAGKARRSKLGGNNGGVMKRKGVQNHGDQVNDFEGW